MGPPGKGKGGDSGEHATVPQEGDEEHQEQSQGSRRGRHGRARGEDDDSEDWHGSRSS